MKVLVTGAAGFVGKELVKHLLGQGYLVRGTVRNTEQYEDIKALGVEPVMADLCSVESLSKALVGIDQVFHIAALFRQAGLPDSEFYRVNVQGTKNLLDTAITAQVKKIIHCSTVGVHGHIANPPASETTEYNPGDHYQTSKMQGEQLFLDYVKSGKIQGSVIRPAMIYGPGDLRTLKLFKMIAARKFFYVGTGKSLVHFIDVRDLAQAFRLVAEKDDINGETFIIAGKTSINLKDLVSIISTLMGVDEPWLHLPVLPMQLLGSVCEALCKPFRINPPIYRRRVDFFTKHRSFDCTKAHTMLGFAAKYSLVEELVSIINSYVELGLIDKNLINTPSVMLRDVCGKIRVWDERARDLYGWSDSQAVGNVSHALLSTHFPSSLDTINQELKSKGFWRGLLVHRSKDGNEVKVDSRWRLLNLCKHRGPVVLELNRPIDTIKNGFRCDFLGESALGYAPALASVL